MNELTHPSVPTMTSREIADLVEKRHDNVKRTIDSLAAAGLVHPQIEDEPEIDAMGRPRITKVYRVGKRDSYVIVAQLSPEFTARLVDRWQQLEALVTQPQRPVLPDFTNPVIAARAWADAKEGEQQAIEQRDRLALQNHTQAQALADAEPKVQALERIAADSKALTVTQAAKVLGIKRDHLTNWLAANKWLYRQNGSWVAYQEYIQRKLLIYKEARYTDENTGQEVYRPYCHLTQKGMARLAELLAREGLLPKAA